MKYLSYNGLQSLCNIIKGDLSSFTGTVIPTFEEVYHNLFQLDTTIDTHIETKVTDTDGSHGIRYNNGGVEYYDNGWNTTGLVVKDGMLQVVFEA